jgi:hypothetical protein
MNDLEPLLIGYFPKRTARRPEAELRPFPAVEEVCKVTCASPEPNDWNFVVEVWRKRGEALRL